MNKLGVFLKKLRADHNEVLFNMAQRLNVSSAFLSAVENGRKSPPISWVNIIASEYQLKNEQKEELQDVITDSIKQVRIDIGEVSCKKKNCALAFARNFDDFSETDISKLMAFLEKGRD